MPARKTEPSVLDYLKAKLTPWRGEAPEIPPLPGVGAETAPAKPKKPPTRAKAPKKAAKPKKRPAVPAALAVNAWPWRSLLAFVLFLFAQATWAGPSGSPYIGVPLFLGGIALFVLAAREGEWRLPRAAEAEVEQSDLAVRQVPLLLALLFFVLTLVSSGDNQFTFINVSFWAATIGFILFAFWQPSQGLSYSSLREWWQARFREGGLNFSVSRWTLLLLAALALAAFFRFSQLSAVPPEMTSDHAEKLFDVFDVLNGQNSIFFQRNTGREPMQFYLTAAVAQLFNTGVSFLSLKIGTALVGFVSLIYMYLLGKELGGKWVGLFALVLTGIAYWPNVLARAALRFILYPGFVAPLLYHMIRAFRRARLNDFLLAGLFMGAGLLGYTPFRIVPLLALGALVLFLLHKPDPETRRRVLIGFALMALVALVVFAPLLRYALDNPDAFGYRMFSRVGSTETEYPGSPILIFFGNLLRALAMANVDAGNIWLVGLLNRPALDLFSAALFLLGVALLVWRYVRSRHWLDLFLLLAVPMLMLPSIMSLAFPQENPALNRAGGALVVIFLITAIGLDALLHGVKDKLEKGPGMRVAVGLGAALILGATVVNYGLVFGGYQRLYQDSSWNTSEMGEVIASFAEGVGSLDQAWVVSYPHWVDTRLVAISAGYPGHDYGLFPDRLPETLDAPAPKLFLLRPEDADGLAALQALYPQGSSSLYESEQANKDFLIYFVAPAAEN